MRRTIHIRLIAACIMSTAGCSSGSGSDDITDPEPPGSWRIPDCASVAGTNRITFSRDFGVSYAERDGDVSLSPSPLARSIVAAAGVPNLLVATTETDVLVSEDSGCNWHAVAPVPDRSVMLLDSGADRVFAWSWDTGHVFRYSVSNGFEEVGQAASDGLRGVGVSSDDPSHLRAVSRGGAVRESLNGGRDWDTIGQVPNNQAVSIINGAEFDPNDIDHVVVSKAREVWTSFDGGRNWIEASGFDDEWDGANIIRSAVSPADSLIVWSYALDLTVLPDLTSTDRKGFFLSTDGGVSFTLELDTSPNSQLPLDQLAIYMPQPSDVDKLVGVHTNVSGPTCVVEMYVYDAASKQLVVNASDDIPSAGSLTHSPASLDYVYVGVERRNLCDNG